MDDRTAADRKTLELVMITNKKVLDRIRKNRFLLKNMVKKIDKAQVRVILKG